MTAEKWRIEMSEMTPEEGFQHKWDRLNHDWSGGSREGYAVCRNCDTTENTPEAATACIEGPAKKFGMNLGLAGVDVAVRAAVEVQREEDAKINCVVIECPECGAEPGDYCAKMYAVHEARYRAAIRAGEEK